MEQVMVAGGNCGNYKDERMFGENEKGRNRRLFRLLQRRWRGWGEGVSKGKWMMGGKLCIAVHKEHC